MFFIDVGWIWYNILGVVPNDYDNASEAYLKAIANEGLKEGTRIAQITRIIRLIRLIRIFKLYRHSHAFLNFTKDLKYETASEKIKRKLKGEKEESNVGQKLSDLTTRRVLVLIILMLL
jgi:hypothetical protein